MANPRKIETDCYAVVRSSGEPVIVGKRHVGYRGIPATFSCSDGCEYQASELKRVTPAEFQRLNMEAEYRAFDRFLNMVDDN